MTFPKYIEHIPSINENFKNLSSDVFIIKGNRHNYVYDAGNSDYVADRLNQIPNKVLIVSHFHHDHIMNIDKCEWDEVYQGALTLKYTKVGKIVDSEMLIDDGVGLHIFYLPNSHAKDFLVLECGDYLFLSDSVYCTVVNNERVYNANLLKEQIECLEGISARYFVISHDDKLVYNKDEVIEKLKSIYDRRNPKLSYIAE